MLLCAPALAQYQDAPLTGKRSITRYGISGVDAYGNATDYWKNRREVGIFRTQEQMLRMGGFNAPGRLSERRPMFYDMQGVGFNPARLAPDLVDEGQLWREHVVWSQVYALYGGFGKRVSQTAPPTTQGLIRRGDVMLEALGERGPVERAMLHATTGRAPIPSLGGAPERMLGLPAPPEAGEPLSHFIDERMGGAHNRAVAEAWEQFAAEDFHEASRLFAGAVALQPEDYASRIGDLFAQLALGHLNSTRYALRSIVARDSAPFSHKLDMAARFSSEDWPRRLRVASEGYARVYLARLEDARRSAELKEETVAEAAALHVFVLWHLGFEAEAQAAGNTLARSFPGTIYAQWPVLMQSARAAPPSQP